MSTERERIADRWWMGPLLMLLWAVFIMAASRCQGVEVVLAWNPNPESDAVTHYRVWRGLDLLGQTAEPRLKVDLPADQTSILTVTAHRGELASRHSQRLVLAPAVVHSSPNMKVWVVEQSSIFFQTLEREGIKTPQQFFRVNYHTPLPETPPTP